MLKDRWAMLQSHVTFYKNYIALTNRLVDPARSLNSTLFTLLIGYLFDSRGNTSKITPSLSR